MWLGPSWAAHVNHARPHLGRGFHKGLINNSVSRKFSFRTSNYAYVISQAIWHRPLDAESQQIHELNLIRDGLGARNASRDARAGRSHSRNVRMFSKIQC